jgi:hypothetical protein
MRAELTRAVVTWFQALSLPTEPIPIPSKNRAFVIALSTLVVRCRSAVERDRYSREIDFVPDTEAPGRLARTLAQVLAAMTVIGITDSERYRLIRKVGLDCIPALRRRALEHVAASGGSESTTQVAVALDHPTVTVRRALEDLAAHKVLLRHSQGSGKADLWELTDWTRDRWGAIR